MVTPARAKLNPYWRPLFQPSPDGDYGLGGPPLETGPGGVMYLPEEGPPPAALQTAPDGTMYLPEEGPPPPPGAVNLPEVNIDGSPDGFANPFSMGAPQLTPRASLPPGVPVPEDHLAEDPYSSATADITMGDSRVRPAPARSAGPAEPPINPRFAFGAMGSGPLGAPTMGGGATADAGAAAGATAGSDPFGGADEYEFVNAQGNVVYSGRLTGLPNPNDVEAQRLGQVFEPLGDDAAAIQEIAKRLQGLVPNEDIIKTATGIYEQQKDRENKLDVASLLEQGKDKRFGRRGGGGAPGTNGVPSAKNLESAFDNVNSIVTGVRGDFKPAASAANRRELMNILEMLESPNALDQRAAIGQKIKSISGAAATDAERNYYMGAAGFWSRMETLANDYMGGGKLSATLVNQLRQHALMMLKREEQNEREASAAAEARLETVPNIDGPTREKHRKALRKYYTGGDGADPTSSGSGGGGDEPAAPGGADDFLSGR